jgi:calpain-7
VFVTLGTGRLSRSEEEALGLVGEHDYAVLDLDSQPGSRRLLVKNPWCDGLVWRSRGASTTVNPKHDPLLSAARLQQMSVPPSNALPTGSFWISLEDVAQNFESMYLNWNPSLFSHRQDHHFTWKMPRNGLALTLADNPQYSLRPEVDGEVWILLSRHFADAELEIAKRRSGSLAAVARQLGFMSIYVFDTDGRRVKLTDGFSYRGPYVDSPQTLAKFPTKKGKCYTVVMAQQDLPLSSYSFTFSFFSSAPVQVKAAEEKMKHFTEISGAWSRRTAGGNASSLTYSQNPQFSISIAQSTPLTLLLATDVADVPVHVDLVWARGERVGSITVKDIVGTSGDYRRGCAVSEVSSVDAGTYTVVCSTFEPGQLGDFVLRVGSMIPALMKAVVADSAGRLRTAMPPLLFNEGEEKKRTGIWVSRLTRASVVARYLGPIHQRATTAIRLSLVYGQGPEESQLAVSGDGEFQEPTGELATTDFDVEPDRLRFDRLWLVVERMGSGEIRSGIGIEILSDYPVNTGQWEVVEI